MGLPAGYTTSRPGPGSTGVLPESQNSGPPAIELRVVTISAFAETEEEGATALVGDGENVLVPEGGDVMFYGDGGAGKTTLAVDLACHLAAGEDWIGFPIEATSTVLLVELEGPRPLFRRKLARKLDGWAGGALGDRLYVLEHPWARLKLPGARDLLAVQVDAHAVDVLIVGPVSRFGMEDAGTLHEVADFMALVADLRRASGRRLTVVLVHHESKGGKVSGAWEGSGDTLLHVQAQGNGHTRLLVQKSRWAPAYHQSTLKLRWAEGQGYEVEDEGPSRPERVWEGIAEYVLTHGGVGWNEVERAVPGRADYLRRRRDQMLEAGELLNTGRGQRFELWHRDDPAHPPLDTTASAQGRGWDAVASDPGDAVPLHEPRPASLLKGDAVRGTRSPAAAEESQP